MKNKKHIFLTIALIAIVGLFIAACGGNDGKDNKEKEDATSKGPLLKFLKDEYGKRIISGQMDTAWTTNSNIDMIARVYADTGKYPAIKGFDFIDLPNSWGGYGKDQVNEAIEWWNGKNNGKRLLPDNPDIHGIVAFCWHWRVGPENDYSTNKTKFRIPWNDGKLDTESDDFKTIIKDLDTVAELLQLLKDKDIPVLWRPLHEASGGWFWWGASGAEPCKALWEYIFNYFTKTKGLDNLIWVWNGQSRSWFPDPATVDIVGYDVYHNNDPKDYSSQKFMFDVTNAMPPKGDIMVALTENGAIPDPDNCIKDDAMWSWFMTWNDAGSVDGQTNKDNFWTGEYHNTKEHKIKVYNHPAVITLDKLPNLSKNGDEVEGDDVASQTIITLRKNGEWGWQYLDRSNSLFNGAKITEGNVYTFTYSFTSNVDIDKFSVYFADNAKGWNRLSEIINVKEDISAGTVVSGTVEIKATGTATSATGEANIMAFDAGTGTLSEPTLTFTVLKLQKN